MDKPEAHYPISVVARRTGLSVHAIRVWERRYGAVQPARTDSNRRLYSESDIDRLRLLHAATAAGFPIGQLAHESADTLRELVVGSLPVRQGRYADDGNLPKTPQLEASAVLEVAKRAVLYLDGQRLESCLAQAQQILTMPVLLEEVVARLMTWCGTAWRDGQISIAQEHFATAAVGGFLAHLRARTRTDSYAPKLVIATPTGQHHEVGALLAAAVAASEGWQELYLGPSLPAAEIVRVAHAVDARAVALSIVHPSDDPKLASELTGLRRDLKPSIAILLGGRAALAYSGVLESVATAIAADTHELRRLLESLRNGPSVASPH